jgi:polyhydroxybutyrate depolymerase
VKQNGCATVPHRTEKGTIRTEIYAGGKDGTEVALYTVNGGGHAWPGGQPYLLGPEPTKEISATDLMWEFFMRNPKK